MRSGAGAPATARPHGVAMVFQSFALFPWLTVLQNVELGLEAQGVPKRETRRTRAMAAIDLIGLGRLRDRLSEGAVRRHAPARRPRPRPGGASRSLLMDEPFSALDVLTAETLRTDLLDLWMRRQAADQIAS